MRTTAANRMTRSVCLIAAIALGATSVPGCAGLGSRVENWCYGVTTWSLRKHELADIRQDTRVALAEQEREALRIEAEREIEAARLDAERRQIEAQFCQANQEALQRQVKRNIRETVESKVAFNVEQGLEIGELQVDVEALQTLIKQREEEAQKRPPEQEPQRKQPCSCCDQPCGCEPGLLRRLCPRCRHKPCEAEKDCGGPEALQRLVQEGQKRPIKPAEIPMKLPVRLSFGFQQPEMEAARIRREPGIEQEPLRRVPCSRCNDPSGSCLCPVPCTQPSGQQGGSNGLQKMYNYQQPARSPNVDPHDVGPTPIPDAEVRQQLPTHRLEAQGVRVGMIPAQSRY